MEDIIIEKTLQEVINEKESRKLSILAELSSMDYLDAKSSDGEDMEKYGDWRGVRRALRVEYNLLEAEVLTLEAQQLEDARLES